MNKKEFTKYLMNHMEEEMILNMNIMTDMEEMWIDIYFEDEEGNFETVYNSDNVEVSEQGKKALAKELKTWNKKVTSWIGNFEVEIKSDLVTI